MQLIVPFCFLCLLILQQTITVTSFTAMMRTPDNEARRLYSARRLRAPLMGRSITTTALHTDDDDDSDLSKSDSNGSSNSNENELITLDKRRSYAVLGGRRWVNSRKRGPLFG
ncbi:unnamed protein product [Adineta steineri]|uniref:Uncharacterized protein n=1 Tax=Adineta steineri TaxID=433720 RepID=A0A814PQT1_9BILA|nr:unnamed protein product [Adineta steineri]CAF1387179.1 unnamed protein product [Adineta steineri]CAF1456947.1 unnamed protein product [Adineta steineri]